VIFQVPLVLLYLLIAGCQIGPRINTFEAAHQPQGITTTVKLRSGHVTDGHLQGELLEVRSNGVLLKAQGMYKDHTIDTPRLVFVPYTAIKDVHIDQLYLNAHENPVRYQDELRVLSRFPQGLSSSLLDTLLEAEGQSRVEVIDRD
jgi:hypothetical protein